MDIAQAAKHYAQLPAQEAAAFGADFVSGLNLTTSAERGRVWAELKACEVKPELKVKNNFQSINKTCKLILAWTRILRKNEIRFVTDIQNKRKLTERQAKWLRDIAQKRGVKITKEFNIRESKYVNLDDCPHDDLGSFGYRHGDTVECPFCGREAEVV